MDFKTPTSSEVENENDMTNSRKEEHRLEVETEGSTGQQETRNKFNDRHMASNNGKAMAQNVSTGNKDDTDVAYTDVTISADDVIRAGGLGARDDISSFLPVAVDSTDFEASLRDARDFEEPQGEIPRPGLGWIESVHK